MAGTANLTEGKQRGAGRGGSNSCPSMVDQAPNFFTRPHHRLLSFTTEPRTGDQAFYTQVLGSIQDPNYSTDLDGKDIIVTFVPSKQPTISKHCSNCKEYYELATKGLSSSFLRVSQGHRNENTVLKPTKWLRS